MEAEDGDGWKGELLEWHSRRMYVIPLIMDIVISSPVSCRRRAWKCVSIYSGIFWRTESTT
jgi:hypothetical protein